MRPPTSHRNGPTCNLLAGYFSVSEACEDFPWLDCIFTGVLALRSKGDTATRSLSRKVLFTVLQNCPAISTRELHTLLGQRYAGRTIERYAAAARVAAKAIEERISMPSFKGHPVDGILVGRKLVDQEFATELAEAEAASVKRLSETCNPPLALEAVPLPRWERRCALETLVA